MDPNLEPSSIPMSMVSDDFSALPSTGEGTGEGGFNLPARNVVACSNCRSQKIKCFPADTQDKPCRRCDKYGLPCAYLQHRRGRKKKLKPEDMSNDSVNGSPAPASKHDTSSTSYHPSVMPKDFAQAPFNDEAFRSAIPQRQDTSRNSYRMPEAGMPGGAGYGSGYSTLMESRYIPTVNPTPFDNTFPRLHPLHGMPGYQSLQPNTITGSHVSTPISADRQTANDRGSERVYNTPFALPGLHSTSIAEGQMPPHMEQIASSSQSLLQLPPPAPSPPMMQMRDQAHGNGGYGGRVTPTVSLLNDKASGGPSNRMSPRDPGPGASPADSSGPTSANGGADGRARGVGGSSASNGSNSNPTRGSSPPIRPIEFHRFPFLSPAIGDGAANRSRSGLTPASLPNILNSTSSSTENRKSLSGSVGNRSTGGSQSQSQSQSSSSKRPSKFSSLHHMVADVTEDSEYDDNGSSVDDEAAAALRGRHNNTTEHPSHERAESKRKRRKIDRGERSHSEEVDQASPFGRDPISSGYVTEHQARELFGIFMSELNSSLPMLDAAVHSFDFVRAKSPFLLSTTLCAASRFLRGGPDTTPELATSIPPERARSVHESCLRLARQQMQLAFQYALSTLEIVQAITLLAIWKEPDDDKAGFYFNRAVVMAKELHLGSIERSRPRTEEEALWRRIRHRVWLCLFIVNTIFAMQFNQILQITHEDPLIANSFDWHIGSHSPMVDLALIASVQLRSRFLHYKSLLEITAADADDLERTDKSHTATLLSLSILTRTSNQDLGNINAHWVEQIREASPTGAIPIKPFIWLAGLRLHLNIVIMNQTIRIENSRRLQRNSLGSIAAFHHSINAACEVLTRMKMLPKRQLAFASDTLLHFTIYAGYFLFTVCTKSTRELLEPQERQHCEDIVIEASEALANASLYPADAPALHARFLRRLTSPYLPPQELPSDRNGDDPPQGHDLRPRSPNNQAIQHAQHRHDSSNTVSPNFDTSISARGFQVHQESGIPSQIALAETIWGGTDDNLWMQFDGAWWDHVMQDMTANNANKPTAVNQNSHQ